MQQSLTHSGIWLESTMTVVQKLSLDDILTCMTTVTQKTVVNFMKSRISFKDVQLSLTFWYFNNSFGV